MMKGCKARVYESRLNVLGCSDCRKEDLGHQISHTQVFELQGQQNVVVKLVLWNKIAWV